MLYPERIGNEGSYYFKNNYGMLSEKFYYADVYKDGFALVKKEETSDWQFRDVDGKLSEKYHYANPYFCSCANGRRWKLLL